MTAVRTGMSCSIDLGSEIPSEDRALVTPVSTSEGTEDAPVPGIISFSVSLTS